jgi:RNA polymerase sigma-70 factor (ECF subfamily)
MDAGIGTLTPAVRKRALTRPTYGQTGTETETRLTAAPAEEATVGDDGDEVDPRDPAAATVPAARCDVPRRFAGGEDAAFDDVVRLYSPRVARLAQRLLGYRSDDGPVSVEDVVQDVFIAALRRRKTFRGETDTSLWSWLATITVNRCRSHGRRATLWGRWLRRRRRDPQTADAPPADAGASRNETRQRVRDGLARLPASDREVIVLYHLEELTVNEICRILGASRGAVDVRLYRARRRLAALLDR